MRLSQAWINELSICLFVSINLANNFRQKRNIYPQGITKTCSTIVANIYTQWNMKNDTHQNGYTLLYITIVCL